MPTIEGAENFPDMMLPNLIVPGAAKSGTTSLHESLQEHPDIFMCRRKEPHFFSREASLDDQRRYEMLFERGESSTSYMVIPDAPSRSQIKIVTFEHFVADHEATMRECFAFQYSSAL